MSKITSAFGTELWVFRLVNCRGLFWLSPLICEIGVLFLPFTCSSILYIFEPIKISYYNVLLQSVSLISGPWGPAGLLAMIGHEHNFNFSGDVIWSLVKAVGALSSSWTHHWLIDAREYAYTMMLYCEHHSGKTSQLFIYPDDHIWKNSGPSWLMLQRLSLAVNSFQA